LKKSKQSTGGQGGKLSLTAVIIQRHARQQAARNTWHLSNQPVSTQAVGVVHWWQTTATKITIVTTTAS